jgi:hypothetical protein
MGRVRRSVRSGQTTKWLGGVDPGLLDNTRTTRNASATFEKHSATSRSAQFDPKLVPFGAAAEAESPSAAQSVTRPRIEDPRQRRHELVSCCRRAALLAEIPRAFKAPLKATSVPKHRLPTVGTRHRRIRALLSVARPALCQNHPFPSCVAEREFARPSAGPWARGDRQRRGIFSVSRLRSRCNAVRQMPAPWAKRTPFSYGFARLSLLDPCRCSHYLVASD